MSAAGLNRLQVIRKGLWKWDVHIQAMEGERELSNRLPIFHVRFLTRYMYVPLFSQITWYSNRLPLLTLVRRTNPVGNSVRETLSLLCLPCEYSSVSSCDEQSDRPRHRESTCPGRCKPSEGPQHLHYLQPLALVSETQNKLDLSTSEMTFIYIIIFLVPSVA